MDRAPRATLLPVIDAYKDLHAWAEIVPFSGAHRRERRRLLEVLAGHVPEAEAPLFPPDVLTDQAERALAAEYVREQVMLQTRQEIPYAAAVEVEEFDEAERRDARRARPDLGARSCVERSRRRRSSSASRARC